MKESKNQSTESTNRLWKNIASGIKEKLNIKEKSISENKIGIGDMGGTSTPFSRLDLTGMNRQQAKELIEKVIDERLEMISQIELTELKIDYKERERQREKAAERISERRNRRRQKASEPAETIVAEDGVYSDYRQVSIFDMIQPETFPFEEDAATPIEGQLSITDVIVEEAPEKAGLNEAAPEQTTPEQIISDQMTPEQTADEIIPEMKAAGKKSKKSKSKKQKDNHVLINDMPEPEAEKTANLGTAAVEIAAAEMAAEEAAAEIAAARIAAEMAAVHAEATGVTEGTAAETPAASKFLYVNTSFDETVDKIFAVYEKNRARLLCASGIAFGKVKGIMTGKVVPAVSMCTAMAERKTAPIIAALDENLGLTRKTRKTLLFLAEQEAVLSDKMYHFIVTADKGCDAFAGFLQLIGKRVSSFYNRARDFAETHKKKLLIGFGCSVAAAAAVTITIGSMTAYEYVYNGKVLGVVKNQEDVYKTIDIIGDKLSYEYDAEITINKDKDIRFNKVVAFGQAVDSKEDILNRLTYMRDMKANGHGIFVDGNMVAVLDSEETAKQILTAIQDTYLKQSENINYKKVGFAENVTVQDVETKLGNIDSVDKVLEYMMTGAVEKKIHVVQSGETFSEIAKIYGLKQSELQESNPDVIPDKLHIGQEIGLNRVVPLVTVQTVEVAQYTETIPFEITYENTNSLYKNEQTVKSKGTDGEKDVVAEIVRNNGVEVSRTEISSTVLSEPISQTVLVGTKEPPPLIGTGTFIYPIRGTLTSRYGTRWGRLHSGIDLAAPTGTKIKAADGGKVIFAGYNGSLGYMVKIDHGGGRVTLYGHCSKIFVKVGERVYQGQHIANVGNTGRSTGPHVHFEVHINGTTKNPLNYL